MAEQKTLDPEDGGWTSRKLWFSIGTSLSILAAGLLAGKYTGIATIYPMMIGGLLAVLGAYCGANVGYQAVVGNHLVKMGSGNAATEADEPIDLAALQRMPGQPTEELPPDHDQADE